MYFKHGCAGFIFVETSECSACFGGDICGAHKLLRASTARPLALSFHMLFEGCHIHLEPAFRAQQLSEVDREAESIVQFKRKFTAELLLPVGDFLFKHSQTAIEGFVEARFFAL